MNDIYPHCALKIGQFTTCCDDIREENYGMLSSLLLDTGEAITVTAIPG